MSASGTTHNSKRVSKKKSRRSKGGAGSSSGGGGSKGGGGGPGISGSGGFFRYHCKNWMTHDCPNWIYVNNSTCQNCLASSPQS